MTIVVVGAGAIGLLVAGRLAESAQRTVLLARPRVAEAIDQFGLRYLDAGTLHVVKELATIADPADLPAEDWNPELAILCVKGYDTAGALPSLEALNPQFILTLQNGIGNEEVLAEHFGAARILSGAITIPVEIEAPGRIGITRHGGIGIAPMRPTAATASGWATGALRSAGFDVNEVDDYRALKWSKALLNILGNATAAILDMPLTEVFADRRMIDLERRAFLEALTVMKRMGVKPVNLPRHPVVALAVAIQRLPPALIDPLLKKLIAGGRGNKPPSLHLGLKQGNTRSEGEVLYGAIARTANELGVDAPVNHALWEILHALATGETSWDTYRRNPDRLLEAIDQPVMAVSH